MRLLFLLFLTWVSTCTKIDGNDKDYLIERSAGRVDSGQFGRVVGNNYRG